MSASASSSSAASSASKRRKTIRYVVVIPVEGKPYITDEVNKDNELEVLQKAVEGYIEQWTNKSVMMMCLPVNEDDYELWDMARKILKHASSQIFVNEDGREKQPINETIIFRDWLGKPSHVYGNIAVRITKAALEKLKIDPSQLKKD